jgi:hypothetical protein
MPLAQRRGVFSGDEAVAFPLGELIVQPAVMGGVHESPMEAEAGGGGELNFLVV